MSSEADRGYTAVPAPAPGGGPEALFSPRGGSKAEEQDKKGRGRRYTVLVAVRFTPEEAARLDALATEAGKARSTFLREAAFGARFGTRLERAGVVELQRLGNNLNQLTRGAHAMRRYELSRRLDEVLAALLEALKEITR
ncbi:MAG: plasmid mobilization relaxosome protein MobC [Thermoanaerobaculia bacterium]|nr:plasmid mobilization relaxosome protein MobC [Thermoanaerobaculia bacterium]